MRDALIVSTARTPIGRAYRGAFNNTTSPTLGGHAIKHAVARAGIPLDAIGDTYMGCSMPQGTQGKNVARQCALAAGLPTSTAAMTVDRQCSSGMMAIATAAKSILTGEIDVAVAGGAGLRLLDVCLRQIPLHRDHRRDACASHLNIVARQRPRRDWGAQMTMRKSPGPVN